MFLNKEKPSGRCAKTRLSVKMRSKNDRIEGSERQTPNAQCKRGSLRRPRPIQATMILLRSRD
ncbi:MAG: hypothetical protein LBI03_09865 [Clostridiales bacterium]|nr:hypothetical protein [Clostridiales bacterium]